jgi:undecaprenyl-diphosphatase
MVFTPIMSLLHIIILAVLQGLTEPLPISSSGHLVLAHHFMEGRAADACWAGERSMDIAVHVGTLLSVLLYYRADLLSMLRGLLHPGSDGFVMVRNIVVGSIPVVIAGFIIHEIQPSFVCLVEIMAWASIVLGLLLWAADKFSPEERTAEQIGWKHAILIGLAQCASLVPGVSRSGICMTAGRFLGYTRVEAARFSLLLSIVAIAGAGVLGFIDLAEEGNATFNRDALIAGVISFVVGYATIAVMIRWLKNFSFTPFAIYRVIMGAVILGMLYTGAL